MFVRLTHEQNILKYDIYKLCSNQNKVLRLRVFGFLNLLKQ